VREVRIRNITFGSMFYDFLWCFSSQNPKSNCLTFLAVFMLLNNIFKEQWFLVFFRSVHFTDRTAGVTSFLMLYVRTWWLNIIVLCSPTLLECQAASAKHKIYTLEAKPTLWDEIIRQKPLILCLEICVRASVAVTAYFLLLWS